MFFKTTWKSESTGLEVKEGWSQRRFVINLNKELHVDIQRRVSEDDEISLMGEKLAKDETTDEASTSGYGSKSTLSRLIGSEKWEAASSIGHQTMVSGDAVIGQDLLDAVERAVFLRCKITTGGTQPERGYRYVQAWLESSETKTSVPDIVTAEDMDRELGNVTETTIGPDGGAVSLRSYQIGIPPNAVKSETHFKFRVSVETDRIKYPKDLIPICLPLHCSPGNIEFLAPVSMKFPTWVRRADLSPNAPSIPVYVYKMHKGTDWKFIEFTKLTPSGIVEFKCQHFCVNAAFIRASDVERVRFVLEHILFKDSSGIYTTCHFLSSDAAMGAMVQRLQQSHDLIHPPCYTSVVKAGDEISVDLISKHPEMYLFESDDARVLIIDENFYAMKRRESLSFLLTPKLVPVDYIDFTFVIGDRKFIKRDIMKKDQPGRERVPQSPATPTATTTQRDPGEGSTSANIIVHGPATIQQTGDTYVVRGNQGDVASTAEGMLAPLRVSCEEGPVSSEDES